MEYLDKPCTRCRSLTVKPPLLRDLKRQPILVRCDTCGKCSRYNIFSHIDDSTGYTLSKWGRGYRDSVRLVVYVDRRHENRGSEEVNEALDSFYPPAV